MRKKKVTVPPASREAARMAIASGLSYKDAAALVGITEHQVMETMRTVPDEVFSEMVQVTSKALLLRCYLKAMAILESIKPEDLEAASVSQKANAISMLLDRAVDKLLPTTGIAEKASLSPGIEDISSVFASIQGQIQRLKIQGVRVEAQADLALRGGAGQAPDDRGAVLAVDGDVLNGEIVDPRQ